MFAKILLKEWRDNRLLLSISGFALVALVLFGVLAHDRTAATTAAAILLCVLPLSALLLGAGAFGPEFRGGAWNYFFSRPISKIAIWIYKYLALLFFLAVGFLVLNLAAALLPGLGQAMVDYYAPSRVQSLVLYALAVWLAFTFSYALSILSERPLVTLALGVPIAAVLFWLHLRALDFFKQRYDYWGSFAAWGLLVGASFALASILTLTRVDFSRTGKKVVRFAGLLVLSLAAAFIASTLVISRGRPFAKPALFFWYSFKIQDRFYAGTPGERMFSYDPKADRFQAMPRGILDLNLGISSAAGKIAYFKGSRSFLGWTRAEACAANLDGSGETVLARFYGTDSSFKGWTAESNIIVSSEGRQAAFVASPSVGGRRAARLFWIDLSGSGLKDAALPVALPFRALAFLQKGTLNLLDFSEKQKTVVFRLAEKDIHSLTVKVIKLNLETGETRSLETTFPGATGFEWLSNSHLSPGRRTLLVNVWDEANKKAKAVFLDLASFETRDAFGELIQPWSMKWSPQEDRLAYYNYRDRNLWVFSAADGSRKIAWVQQQKGVGLDYDWLADGRLLVGNSKKEGEGEINVLSPDLALEKTIKIPEEFLRRAGSDGWGLVALGDKALVRSKEGVWRVALQTEEWKKVY